MRIVIADDQKRTRLSLKALLSTTLPEAEIREAADGAEALRVVEDTHPDLVVMDIRMPGVDGITATRGIKSRWPDIRVLALSLDPTLRDAALTAGADAFVGKGDSPERLLCAISSLL